jgi:ubiquinone biosynthesis protein UbiJ
MRADEFVVTHQSLPKRLWSRLPVPRLISPQGLKLTLPEPTTVTVRVVNALLAREDWACERLLRHAGKTVRLAWRRSAIGLTITSEGRVQPADLAIVPDVTVTVDDTRVNVSRLLSLRSSGDESVILDATHISGEAGLAQVVGELARHLRLDLEDVLAQRLGDIPSMRVLRGLRAVSRGLGLAVNRLGHNVAEFLAEERRVVLGRPAFEAHRRAQAELDARLDALAAQVNRLKPRAAKFGAAHSGAARPNLAQPRSEGQG